MTDPHPADKAYDELMDDRTGPDGVMHPDTKRVRDALDEMRERWKTYGTDPNPHEERAEAVAVLITEGVLDAEDVLCFHRLFDEQTIRAIEDKLDHE